MSKKEKKDWHQFKEEHQENPFEEEGEEEGGEGEQDADLDVQEASLEHPDYTELSEKLTLAEQQAHENWEQKVRALAELKNYRERAEREIQKAHTYGVEKLLTSLLPVVDSMEQALQLALNSEDVAMREGLELTLKLFIDVLQKFDVELIDAAGQPFDPKLHEAMSIQETPDVAPNTVVAVYQKGYKLADRVIRPARVVVSK